MNKNSKILITGSEGMVGRNLIEKLDDLGYINLIYKNSTELDLTKRKDVFNFFGEERPIFVIHLASVLGGIGDKIIKPVRYLRDNILINTNVIDACVKSNVKKMINLSSACIYPINTNQPMKETNFRIGSLETINEGYALSKIVSLKLCEYYNKEKNTNFITLVAPNLYGKYDHFNKRGHVISSLISKIYEAKIKRKANVEIWGTGEAKREFLFANDLSKMIILVLDNIEKKDLINNILNCGLGNEISIKELAILIKDIVGFHGQIKFDKTKPEGVRRRILDSSKLLKLINFKNKTNFKSGLEKTYNYHLKDINLHQVKF